MAQKSRGPPDLCWKWWQRKFTDTTRNAGPVIQPVNSHFTDWSVWSYIRFQRHMTDVLKKTLYWHNDSTSLWLFSLVFRFRGPGSVVGIATGYGLDSLGIKSWWGARFSARVQTGPGVHPASYTMGTGSFPGVKSGRGVTLTPHPLLVPWSWKSTAIPLLSLCAVRPVQYLSACTRMRFTLPFFRISFASCRNWTRWTTTI